MDRRVRRLASILKAPKWPWVVIPIEWESFAGFPYWSSHVKDLLINSQIPLASIVLNLWH